MYPQIVQDAPGTCPICGMDLAARAAEAPMTGYPEVRLDGALMQNLGLRTTRVERGNLWEPIRALGRVQYDETRIAHLHTRASGWITRLAVRAEGETVIQGQTLAEFYAPNILAAQIDFLLALGHSSSTTGGAPRGGGSGSAGRLGGKDTSVGAGAVTGSGSDSGAGGRTGGGGGPIAVKADKAHNLLRLLDVPEAVIDTIQTRCETRDTIPIPAPITGVVTGLTAREGMYVTPDSTMFTLVDHSQVWVRVDVFEHQIAGLESGQTAQMRVPAYPGRTWEGGLDYLYPELDPKTRTLPVRLVFDNPVGALRPNLFAEVSIEGEGRRNVLKIPREALIHTGERESVVLARGEGRFQPVDVTTGARLGGEMEILAGLIEHDEVVVSGQFLIDSESSLRASFQRLTTGGAGARP
jgi:Cu(I)/Ag(I) efflux system membrane fusion protein